jgi:hypothetical protein
MKNNKTIPILMIVVSLMLLGLVGYMLSGKNKEIVPVNEPAALSTSVVYRNSDFGFNFALPNSWKGYSIVENNWEGYPLTVTSTKQTGVKLLIRNPKWTSVLPYQDIPVMIFTLAQWNSYIAEDFSVSAAPVLASELGRNNLYVFALPPRWDFDYSEGYQEADSIVKSDPLKVFTVQNSVSGRLNIDAVCEAIRSLMTFPDSISADTFATECKEGKHPEVIEKYETQTNVLSMPAI